MEDLPLTNAEYPELPVADRPDLEIGRFVRQFGMLESTVATLTWIAMNVGPPDGPQVPSG
jgi:hypothetical protein